MDQKTVDSARLKRAEDLVRAQVESASRLLNELPAVPDHVAQAQRFAAILNATAVTFAAVVSASER